MNSGLIFNTLFFLLLLLLLVFCWPFLFLMIARFPPISRLAPARYKVMMMIFLQEFSSFLQLFSRYRLLPLLYDIQSKEKKREKRRRDRHTKRKKRDSFPTRKSTADRTRDRPIFPVEEKTKQITLGMISLSFLSPRRRPVFFI